MIIKKKKLDKVIAHCKSQVPIEACGILAGKDGRVERVYQMENTDKSGATFFMEPKEQLKVMKEIRSQGLQMVGIYHSHTQSQAYPSSHDVELAFYPEVSYVIVSLKDQNKPEVKSFKIKERGIEEEELKIE